MPLNAFGEVVLQPILEMIFQLLCYGTGWLFIPFFTLGRVYVEPTSLKEFVKPGKGRLQISSNGRYIMDAELAALFGMLFWFLIGIGAYFIYNYT